jgi:hypothetical protein
MKSLKLQKAILLLALMGFIAPHLSLAEPPPWEKTKYIKKMEKGKILSLSKVEDLPEGKKKLIVDAFGYVDHPKNKIRKVSSSPEKLQKLSKNIKRTEILYKNDKERVFLIEACFMFCKLHYEIAVRLQPYLGKKKDRIKWVFLSKKELKKITGKTIASATKKEDFDFIGFRGETFVEALKPNKSLIALKGVLITDSSFFIRFFQKVILRSALIKTALEMRENLKNI